MRTVVVIPMKDVADAKTRLACALRDAERGRMALALYRATLAFFRVHYPEFERLVVTSSPRIAEVAKDAGASVLREEGGRGLNAAVQSSFDWVTHAAFRRLLIVPADIPVWLRTEVDELLAEGAASPVVVARARDGGTNALLLDLARVERFDFRYGPDSARRHAESAAAQDLPVVTRTWPFLRHDIDTVDDCLAFSDRLAALMDAE